MSYVKFGIHQHCIIHIHPCLLFFSHWLHFSLHSFLESHIIITVIKEKERGLRQPYQTHAKARIMSEIEEIHEQMKADMKAMKKQMTIIMEAMISMRKMMEVNTATIIAASTTTKVNPLILLASIN